MRDDAVTQARVSRRRETAELWQGGLETLKRLKMFSLELPAEPYILTIFEQIYFHKMGGPPNKKQKRQEYKEGREDGTHTELPKKKFYRQRAHANPFSDHKLT